MTTPRAVRAGAARSTRSIAAVGLATVATAALMTASGPAPHAAATTTSKGYCYVAVKHYVALTASVVAVPLAFSSNCRSYGTTYGTWLGADRAGRQQGVAAYPNRYVAIRGSGDIGTYTWRSALALDRNHNPSYQNGNATSDVRLGSKSYIATNRVGVRDYVWTENTHYTPAARGYRAYAGWHGYIQIRPAATNQPWRTIKNVYSDSAGQYRYNFVTRWKWDIRVYYPYNWAVWNNLSPASRCI